MNSLGTSLVASNRTSVLFSIIREQLDTDICRFLYHIFCALLHIVSYRPMNYHLDMWHSVAPIYHTSLTRLQTKLFINKSLFVITLPCSRAITSKDLFATKTAISGTDQTMTRSNEILFSSLISWTLLTGVSLKNRNAMEINQPLVSYQTFL
jgi:hypothetical protein